MPKTQQLAGASASSDELPGVEQQQSPDIPPDGTPPAGAGGGNEKDKDAKPGNRLNLVRFLQEKPQQSGIRALLNTKHRNAVLTMAEWEDALAELLGKKTK
ncbi:hypothetical protein FACS1894137_07310 [Spirochaetia bacterium]|nr:hypothetical protein FACS1894137_07310 [Spirochaetia bacterium]